MPEVTREVESTTSDSVDTPPTFRKREIIPAKRERERKKGGGVVVTQPLEEHKLAVQSDAAKVLNCFIVTMSAQAGRTLHRRCRAVNTEDRKVQARRQALHAGLPHSELALASAAVDQGLEEFSIQSQTYAFLCILQIPHLMCVSAQVWILGP